jgi:hypothetical protein
MRVESPAREIPGILLPFLLTIAAIALTLRLLNAVPGYWEMLTAQPVQVPPSLTEHLRYSSIEEMEGDLGVSVALPSYFPSYLVWPPDSVRGQRDPAPVASLLFVSTEGQQALQIRQVFWSGDELPFEIPEPLQVLERRAVEMEGGTGLLLIGQSQAGAPLNQLRWRNGDVHRVVTTIYSEGELLRIARSMHLAGRR